MYIMLNHACRSQSLGEIHLFCIALPLGRSRHETNDVILGRVVLRMADDQQRALTRAVKGGVFILSYLGSAPGARGAEGVFQVLGGAYSTGRRWNGSTLLAR